MPSHKTRKALAARVMGGIPQHLVLEYPKCGRTWLRFMICSAEARAYGLPLESVLWQAWYPEHGLPRVVYQHGIDFSRPLAEGAINFSADRSRPFKSLTLLYRDPIRVMISFFFHERHRMRRYDGTLATFIRDPHFGAKRYAEYVAHYRPIVEAAGGLIISYEEMRRDTSGVLAKVLGRFEIPADQATVDLIVAGASLERLQRFAEGTPGLPGWITSSGDDPKGRKFRSGGAERIDELLTAADVAYVREAWQGHSLQFEWAE